MNTFSNPFTASLTNMFANPFAASSVNPFSGTISNPFGGFGPFNTPFNSGVPFGVNTPFNSPFNTPFNMNTPFNSGVPFGMNTPFGGMFNGNPSNFMNPINSINPMHAMNPMNMINPMFNGIAPFGFGSGFGAGFGSIPTMQSPFFGAPSVVPTSAINTNSNTDTTGKSVNTPFSYVPIFPYGFSPFGVTANCCHEAAKAA